MKLKVKSAIISLLLLSSWTYFAYAQSFNPVFDWISRIQKGEEIEIKIKVTFDHFTIFGSEVSDINQYTYNRELGDRASKTIPQLEVLPQGLVKEYKIDETVCLKEISKDDGSTSWQKLEYKKIATYPINSWRNFISHAVSHGLKKYEHIEYKGNPYFTLYFDKKGPSTLKFRNRDFKFTDEFYHYMKFVKGYKSWLPAKAKSVILVHEPHWSLNGQYQLVSGIKALISANPDYKFRFLVEGYYEPETYLIPTTPLNERFSEGIPRSPQVFGLLENFMIDGPLAYRLMYDPELPAIAIDDVELIKQTPPDLEIKAGIEVNETLIGLEKKLRSLGESYAVQSAYQALIDLFNYENASVSEIHGQDLIDYYNKVASLYKKLSDEVEQLQKSYSALQVREEINFFNGQARAYRNNAKRFEYALDRDRTMVNNISKHFNSEYADRIPIAFIGSFHTAGMTSMLRSKGIGYIVIEPWSGSIVITREEEENFNRALSPTTRQSYLANLATSELKLPVSPTRAEINRYYAPYLTNQASQISNRIKRRKEEIIKLVGSNINYSLLDDAMNNNGNLIKASLGFGGGGNIVPPSDFNTAFAHFDPQGDGNLFIYNERDSKWQDKARYNFLAAAMLILPNEKFKDKTRKTRFVQDKESNILFYNVYDAGTQRFYLFEGKENVRILPLLSAPKPPPGKSETTVHIRVTVIVPIKPEEKVNG